MQISSKLLEHGKRNNTVYPFYLIDVECKAGENAIRAHWHEEFEIIYTQSDGMMEINSENIKYKYNDVIIVNKEYLHKGNAYSDGNLYAIVFDYEFLDFKHKDLCQIKILDKLKSGELLFPAVLPGECIIYNDVKKCVSDIIELCHSRIPGKELKIKNILYEIIFLYYSNDLLIVPEDPEKGYRLPIVEYVKSTIKYMETNFSSQITADDLAKNVGLDKSYLMRIFKKITGVTPITYLKKLRIENSVDLLNNDAPVSQAAMMSGFNNISYYIKTFKEIYNISPNKFKKSCI